MSKDEIIRAALALAERASCRARGAAPRKLCLNSPLNPTGTAFTREDLLGICEAVLEENEGRARRGERPLFLLYDQIYWMLCFGGVKHVTPPELIPEMARYTVFVDGISKGFAATGLRVGWAVGPVDVISRMSDELGHVGAWAPRAEQVATVGLLDDPEAIRQFEAVFQRELPGAPRPSARRPPGDEAAGPAGGQHPAEGAIDLTARRQPGRERAQRGTWRRRWRRSSSFATRTKGRQRCPSLVPPAVSLRLEHDRAGWAL